MFVGIFEPSVPSGSGLSPVSVFFFNSRSISTLDGMLVSCRAQLPLIVTPLCKVAHSISSTFSLLDLDYLSFLVGPTITASN